MIIDEATISRIFETVDIYDIISEFVKLKKRGVNYVGSCPFHDEKTASFTVSPSKGIYKCFGCGKGGNAINFIMEHEHFSYVEALRFVAEKYNIEIKEKELTDKEKQSISDRESMLIVSKFAADFFENSLWNTDEGKSVGYGYLKMRGLNDDIIKKFNLGYSPSDWNAIINKSNEAGYKLDYLIKCGLVGVSEKGNYDRFRERVIFPVRDIAGKIIAFGGRAMADNNMAKYVNSPESEIYHKSRTLYGIFFAKSSIIQEDRCYLVEGYLDVISFHQKGITNTVASSGTSLTVEQIRLIRRLTKNITIIYDGDNAGIKAAMRGIDLAIEEDMNVRILPLPEGEDPDSFAKQLNRDSLKDYITEKEEDFIRFKLSFMRSDIGDDPIKKAAVIKEIVNTLSKISDSIKRLMYIKEVSKIMELEENFLISEIAYNKRDKNYSNKKIIKSKPNPKTPNENNGEPCSELEKMLIKFLINYGDKKIDNDIIDAKTFGEYIICELEVDELNLLSSEFANILSLYEENYSDGSFNTYNFFVNNINPEISRIVVDIIAEPYELSSIWGKKNEDEDLLELLIRLINVYKLKRIDLLIADIDRDMFANNESRDETVVLDLIRQRTKLLQIKASLSNKLGYNILT